MKSLSYEPCTGSLTAFLLGNLQCRPFDLYTFTLKNGTVLRYTNADIALKAGTTNLIPAASQPLSAWTAYNSGSAAQTLQTVSDPVFTNVYRITKTAGVPADRAGRSLSISGLSGSAYSTDIYYRVMTAGATGYAPYLDAAKSPSGLVTVSNAILGTETVGVWNKISKQGYGLLAGTGTLYAWIEGAIGSTVDFVFPKVFNFPLGGTSYTIGPVLRRSRTGMNVGISVDRMNLEIYADSTILVGSVGIITAIAFGLFDGATVQVDHAFFDDDMQCQGIVPAFFGSVGEVKTQRGRAELEIRSQTELLDILVPGDIYQASCKNTLYDNYCGKSKAASTISAGIASGITANNNTFTGDSGTNGQTVAYFDMGVVTFTSGPNTGISRTIKKTTGIGGANPLTFEFISPFPYTMVVGNTFTASQGCQKTVSGCTTQFSNQARFRGEPFIPAPETVV